MKERARSVREQTTVKRRTHSKRTVEISIQPTKTTGEINVAQLLQEINQAPKLFKPPKRHKHH